MLINLLILLLGLSIVGGCGSLGSSVRTATAPASDPFGVKRIWLNPNDTYGRTYEARWDRDEPSKSVRMQLNPNHLWGNHFDLVLLDAEGREMARGFVTSETEHEFPYALIEMRSSSDLLPPDARDRWILGLVFASEEIRFVSSRRTIISDELTVGKGDRNIVRAAPVEWSDWVHGKSLRPVSTDASTEYRWGERSMVDKIEY